MAYSSENSCKKGCSCDSCKGSHKSIKSEGILKTVKDLAKKAKDTATVEIGKALPDVDPDMSGPFPGIGVVVNPLAAKVARNPTVRKIANTVRKAVAENSNYIGSPQHYKDLVDRHENDIDNFKKERDPYARQHLQMIAKKSLENVQNHPLHSKQPIKEDLNAPIRKPSDYVTHVFSFREGEEHGVHVGTWHGDKFTANDSNHPIYGTGKSYQKHNTLAPPGDFKRLPHENAANEVHVVAKPIKELDMNNDDSRKHWHEHHQSMSAMFDSLAKRTGTAKEKYEWKKKAAHHQDEAMKVRPEFYTNPITGKSEEPHHVKDFEKWTAKPKETSDEKKAESMLKESKFVLGDTVVSKEPIQGMQPGHHYKVVDVTRTPSPIGNFVVHTLMHKNGSKIMVNNLHAMPVERVPFADKEHEDLDKRYPQNEELKTVDDVTKTLPRGVEKKGPGEAYGDVEKCAPAQKDKDKTVVAGKTGEEYSKKPQEEVKQMSEDKYAKLAEAAFGPLNRSNPFRNAPMKEEVEHLDEVSYEKAKNTLVALNKMGHDRQDPATTRFVRHDLKAPPGAYLDTSGERNVARSFDEIARHIERKHGRAAAAAAAHAAIGGPFKSSDSYGSAWVSDKFKALAAEHKPEKMDEDVASFKAGYSPKQVTTNKGFLGAVGQGLKGLASSAVNAAGNAALNVGRAGVNVVGRKIADTARAGMNEPSKLGKVEENNINNRNYYVEKDIAEIMKETYKKKMKMQEAMDIHIASPEQREDWLSVGRGAMDVLDYINKYKV